MMIDPWFVGREARDAPGVQLLVLGATVVGVGFFAIAVRTGLWAGALLGGSMLLGAAQLRLCLYGRHRPVKRLRETWGADGVEIRIGLRPHRPLSLLCSAASLTMMLGSGLLLVESAAGTVAMAVLLPLPILMVPDSVRGLLAHGREVVLTPRTLTYRGWSYDIEVPWDDLVHVGGDRSNPWLPSIRFDLFSTATTQAVTHRILIRLEKPPQPRNFQIPFLAVDHPTQLLVLAGLMALRRPEERALLLARDGLRSLAA